MTVLIGDGESDAERDVCQILEMFSPILLKCLSLSLHSLQFLEAVTVPLLTEDFTVWLEL